MAKRRLGLMLALSITGVGVAATVFWLTLHEDTAGYAYSNFWPLLLSLFALVGLTSFNLAIRWFRWHYLLRCFRLNLRAKDSVAVWLMTLPAIATPFYLGELVRAGLLARRYPQSFWTIAGVWILERISDALVIGMLLLVVQQRWQILSVVIGLIAISAVAIRSTLRSYVMRTIFQPAVLGLVFLGALVAWLLPILGLWNVLRVLQAQIPPASVVEAFGIGTLLGGLTGLPLGIGITGSTMIILLQLQEVRLEVAALAVAVFRAGTVWYALGIGVFAFLRWKGYFVRLLRVRQHEDHFDLIAHEYEQNIPQHLRDRLVARKTELMLDWLINVGAEQGWVGLDIGCGHGWYASEMARHGYSMSACDISIRQTEEAGRHIRKQGVMVSLYVADAISLPYEDCSFDFVYGVNVIHHIPQERARRRAISEIRRVLKPGSLFFLQEINTQNPLFRFYIRYVFPLLREIDEGTESWVMPTELPVIEGASWQDEIQYFNFLPDFAPPFAIKSLTGVERFLEGSRLKRWSSHYVACLKKRLEPPAPYVGEDSFE